MSRDVTGAYVRAQAFKDAHARGADGALMEALRVHLRAQVNGLGLPPRETHAALYSALSGIAWTTAMMRDYDLPLDPTMDVAEQISSTTARNAPWTDPFGLQLGVGAGYFTGLLMGLDMGVTKR